MNNQISFPLAVYIQVTIVETNITTCALIDTGSDITIFKNFLIKSWNKNSKIKITGVTGESTQIIDSAEKVNIILGSKQVIINKVYNYNKLECDILLGNDFIQQFQYYKQNNYMIMLQTPCAHLLKIPREFRPYRVQPALRGDKWEKRPIVQDEFKNKKLSYKKILKTEIEINMGKIIEQLERIYGKNPLLFWKPYHPKAKIELTENVIIRVRPMMYTLQDMQEFKIQIKELLEQKLIRPSNGPHSSPAFMVMKHSEQVRGKARMVINYKELNKYTKFDGYFLPNKEVLINLAKGKQYYSKFDCKSGFWQIKMEEDSIQYTAFSTPQGKYEWLVMPFGLKNAPQIFQRKMDNIFKKYSDFLIVYIDDILIYSNNKKEHRNHLLQFINECKKEGIVLSKKKSIIKKQEIDFLGLSIDRKGIKLQTHISKKIESFPDELKSKEQIQKFLGCLNYAEGFIENLSKKRHKIQILLRKTNTKGWNKEHTEIVKALKEECKNLPKLRLPDEKDNLIVNTDASDKYWAAILKTDLNEICRYSSGTFNQVEINYTTHEKELLAIIRGIKKFSLFLLSKKFIVETDNSQVAGLIRNKLPMEPQYRRLHRWQAYLSFYNFDIVHIKGINNYLADFLSRNIEFGDG